MGNTIPTSHGAMSPESVVDYLTYANYRHNRNIAPHVTPERWAKIYPGAAALEAKYQAEQAIAKAAA